MIPCLKQTVVCVIVRDDGRRYEAANLCAVDGLSVCPRAGLPSGALYELCQPVHAEAVVALLAADSSEVPGTAYVTGHEYLCPDCQRRLAAVNVRRFVLGEAPCR